MALIPDNVPTREDADDIRARFGIAQDGKPTAAQLDEQKALKLAVSELAVGFNANVADGREKSVALTHLEEFLLWAGKAIFK